MFIQAKKNPRIADYSLDDENYRTYQQRANQSQKKADEIGKKVDETVANSGESGIIFVEPLSRYLNSSDKLFEYSRKVKPIDGYEDVFIHGDKNGNEHTYLTPREFAELLKEDPNYNGGDIRLFACETGADGAMAAKALATQLGKH